jgi:hypothetical protein
MEKVSLPIKTKIAAWWMKLIALIGNLYFFIMVFSAAGPEVAFALIIEGPIFIVWGILFWLSSALIFKRRKLGWWLSMVFLFITILIFYLVEVHHDLYTFIEEPFLFLIFIIFLVPFIFLLLDRKNFWKVAK